MEAGNSKTNESAVSGVLVKGSQCLILRWSLVISPSRGDKSHLHRTRGTEGHKELEPVPSSPFVTY